MNRFLVVLDLITINSPILHSGHGINPFFGEFVPRIMYFFSLADQERYPSLSKYWTISFLNIAVIDFVVLTMCLILGFLISIVLDLVFLERISYDEFIKTIFIGKWVSEIRGKGLRSWCW